VNRTDASPIEFGNSAKGSPGGIDQARAGPTTSIRYDSTVVPRFKTRTTTAQVSPGTTGAFGASRVTTGSVLMPVRIARGSLRYRR
jgi:hypothetical protein